MMNVTINGQQIEVPAGATVLQATRMAGIEIPTLCDHPALKPYGGCRLCVVEVQGMRALQASCTLPVSNGMVIQTDTPKIHKAREFVLTLLFSERNHFCMYCEKTGGDCELQNAAYGEGMTHWPLQPNWKPYPVDASGPYYVTDHNRCILCRRCVRACSQLVGNATLDIENRGASSLLVADYGLPIGESTCVSCGTCVQVCPTGALIDRSSAYLGKDAEADHVRSVCTGCSVGCGIEMVVHDNQLARIDGDWSAPVNGGVLCELGRYLSLRDHRERIETPLVRRNGSLEPASWEEAFRFAAERMAPLKNQNGTGVAAIASTRLTAEALHLFTELFRSGMGSGLVTSVEEDFTSGASEYLAVDTRLQSLKESDCVVVLGTDLYTHHQVAGFFVKRNLQHGTRLVLVDPNESSLADYASASLQPRPGTDERLLKGIMAAVIEQGMHQNEPPAGFEPGDHPIEQVSMETGVPVQNILAASRLISMSSRPVFVYGKGLTRNGTRPVLGALHGLSALVDGEIVNLRGKANSMAAEVYSLNQPFELNHHRAVYLALGDDEPAPRLLEQLEAAPFLVVQASHRSAATERADIVFPVEMWAEQEGHFINLEGRLQQACRALVPPAQVRSNAGVLTELARTMGVSTGGFWMDEISRRLPEEAHAAG